MATTLFPRPRALFRSWRNAKHQRPKADRFRKLVEEPLEERTVLSAITPFESPAELDFTGDGIVDRQDLQLMNVWIGPEGSGNIYHSPMDINRSGDLTREDVLEFCKILRTTPGDVDYDGDFDDDDLIIIQLHNQCEDGLVCNSTWETGDVTGDREVTTEDLVYMMEHSVLNADGDVNGDGRVDVEDIQIVNCWVGATGGSCLYVDKIDVNRDGTADREDVDFLVRLVGTCYGDANLDGVYDTGDLVRMMEGGKYETGERATWLQGDFNGDERFDSNDLVFATEGSLFGLDQSGVDFIFAANVAS